MEKNVLLCFNSTLVQLKVREIINTVQGVVGFNSTLVQLKDPRRNVR